MRSRGCGDVVPAREDHGGSRARGHRHGGRDFLADLAPALFPVGQEALHAAGGGALHDGARIEEEDDEDPPGRTAVVVLLYGERSQ
jgi:hypothetical protein